MNLDGSVDILDIFCVLDGFADRFTHCTPDQTDIAPCGGDDRIDVFDIFAVVDAFLDRWTCPGMCLEFIPPWPGAAAQKADAASTLPKEGVPGARPTLEERRNNTQ